MGMGVGLCAAVQTSVPPSIEASGAEKRESWDLRAAVCAVGSQDLSIHSDETLLFLLRNAVDRHTMNDLFTELFRRHHTRVAAWCCQFTRQPDTVPDLVQDVFFRAFRRLYTYRGDSRFSTWLYVITRNHCLNAIKKRIAEPSQTSDAAQAEIQGPDGREILETLQKDQSFRNMWRLIHATLTPTEARVMALHFGHGLPVAVITRQMMLSNASGAKAYIVSARRKLKAVLRNKKFTAGGAYGARPVSHSSSAF
jgi:RNA polymerase sigma-70 factor, ECF subfamily